MARRMKRRTFVRFLPFHRQPPCLPLAASSRPNMQKLLHGPPMQQLFYEKTREMIINQAYGLYKTDPAVLRDQRSRRTRALKMPPRLKFAPQLKYSPLETVSTLECAAVEATEVTTPPRPVVALVDA